MIGKKQARIEVQTEVYGTFFLVMESQCPKRYGI